jgi:hypothetical protein
MACAILARFSEVRSAGCDAVQSEAVLARRADHAKGRRVTDAYLICSGTARNCAGGATPWNTWLRAIIGMGFVEFARRLPDRPGVSERRLPTGRCDSLSASCETLAELLGIII